MNWVDPEGLSYALPIQWGFRTLAAILAANAANDTGKKSIDLSRNNDQECNQCPDYKRIYEENDKHGPARRVTGGGRVIARRSSNGAYALSISAPTGSRRRVAYDIGHGEIVILHETRTDEQNCIKYYHGFVADYMSDLRGRCDIVNTIKKNGWPLPPKR